MGINGDRFIMLYMCLTFKKGYKWGQVYYALHVLNIQKKVMYYLPVPYSAVFEGVAYKFAQPVNDYAARFQTAVDEKEGAPAFACNCILNFLYGELEGKKTGAITGPITFGEIAYQLLNQTMVCLEVNKL
jgi:hypothetical protein